MIKIYTGYFAKISDYEKLGIVPVGIALGSPHFFHGLTYKKLAPKPWMLTKFKTGELSEDEYVENFKNLVLKYLSVEVVKIELEALSEGKDIVLLCWEATGKFCHRNIVAEWIGCKELIV